MKLYLSSYKFGDHTDALKKLVGKNKAKSKKGRTLICGAGRAKLKTAGLGRRPAVSG
jgi:hypothetical protein